MMKKSSTYAAAKGTIPAAAIPILGFRRGDGSGIARAMVDVTVGNVITSWRYPKYAPKKTRGTEIQTHIATRMRTSIKGTDALEWKKKRRMLKNKKSRKRVPGKIVAVNRVHICH